MQCVCFQVVISSIHCTYIPTKLCVLLEDAKELAAWTALWNLSTVIIHTLFSPLCVLYVVCISVSQDTIKSTIIMFIL